MIVTAHHTLSPGLQQMLGWTIPETNHAHLLNAWRELMAANQTVDAFRARWLAGHFDDRRISQSRDDRYCRNAWEGLVLGYWLARTRCD